MPIKKRNPALPGFPWKEKFQDMDRVREYFSYDKLQCLLCGREFKGLGNHVVEGHGLAVDKYKEQFGLPWTFGLNGRALKEAQGKRLNKARREGKIPRAPSPEHIRMLQIYKKKKNRKPAAAVRREAGKRVLQRLGLDRKWAAEDYEEFLRRIKKGRTAPEVGKNKDMPAAYLFQKHMQSNPEFRRRFEDIWDHLPFAVQSRGLHFGERIKNRVIEIRMTGKTFPEVGSILGIPEHTARSIWFNAKRKSTGTRRKMLENYEKSLRSTPEMYEEFLKRIKTGRTPSEVGRDKDMPSRLAFDKHVRENPMFRKRYNEVWETLPFPVQVRGQRTGKRFRKEVVALRLSGLSWEAVARKLGVRLGTVTGLWLRLKKTGTPSEKKIISHYTRKIRKARFWSDAEMNEFLRRIKSGRTPTEVARDADMPRREFFDKYVNKHSAYDRKYQKIWESLPFAVQLRGNRLGERFKRTVVLLKRKGFTNKQIGEKLGVKAGTVNSAFFRLKKKEKVTSTAQKTRF